MLVKSSKSEMFPVGCDIKDMLIGLMNYFETKRIKLDKESAKM